MSSDKFQYNFNSDRQVREQMTGTRLARGGVVYLSRGCGLVSDQQVSVIPYGILRVPGHGSGFLRPWPPVAMRHIRISSQRVSMAHSISIHQYEETREFCLVSSLSKNGINIFQRWISDTWLLHSVDYSTPLGFGRVIHKFLTIYEAISHAVAVWVGHSQSIGTDSFLSTNQWLWHKTRYLSDLRTVK